jgi:catalase
VHNNQRDGMHRQAVHRGRVAYEPNSLGGGCPFQAGMAGFTTRAAVAAAEDKVRGKPELFADHYSQARCSGSASPAEQAHIVNAFRFELTKVQTPAIACGCCRCWPTSIRSWRKAWRRAGLEVPPPMPLATDAPSPHYVPSPALSLLARPGVDGIKTRKVAILATHGVDAVTLKTVYADLLAAGAVPRVVAPQLGSLQTGRRPAGCRDLHRSRSGGGVRRADRGDGASAACCKAMPTRVNSCGCNTATASRSSRWARARTSSGGRVADGVPDPALWCGRRRCPRQGGEFKQALAGHRHCRARNRRRAVVKTPIH